MAATPHTALFKLGPLPRARACSLAFALALAACGDPLDPAIESAESAPETPAPKAGRTDDAQAIMDQFGQCTAHNDCPDGSVCAAVSPGRTECVANPELARQYRGPDAVPNLPPHGVLDGSVRQFGTQTP